MDETNTIKSVLEGDTQAYALLVDRYHIGVIIHCERLVGDRDEAEDIAQKAFIQAYQKLGAFDADKARFSTWLYRIATNLAIDSLRGRRPTISLEDLELAAPDPDYFAIETAQETRAAVSTLDRAELRRVVEAYYWEGKSYQEMADELHVPINTIKSWLHRAKQQLREKLS